MPRPPQKCVVEQDDLGVDRRVVRAERLDRELPVLPVAPAAGRPVAIHRGDRVELLRLWRAVQAVLDVRPRDRRRAFGTERQRPVRAVRERVHLLLHDVRALAGRAREEVRVLEDRRLDPPVAGERAEALHLVGDAPPERLLGREDVVGPAGPLDASRAQLGEERVAGELGAERRRRPVTRVDDRLGRIRLHERADRVEQRVPVAERAGPCGRPSRRKARRPRRASRRRSRRGARASGRGRTAPGTRRPLPPPSRRRRAASPPRRRRGSGCPGRSPAAAGRRPARPPEARQARPCPRRGRRARRSGRSGCA